MLYTQDNGASWIVSSAYDAGGDGFNAVALRQTAGGDLVGVAGDLRQKMYSCAGSGCL